MLVGVLLAGSATMSGALVGFFSAIALGWPVEVGLVEVSAIVLAGVLADLVRLSTGRPKPIARRSQVPREWGTIFSPPVVAILYGARLGVGPLTMLSTWLWWSAWLASGLLGPMAAVSCGATFGLARVVSMALVRPPVTRLRSVSRPSWLALDAGAVLGVVILSLVVVGCSRTGDVSLEPRSEGASVSEPTQPIESVPPDPGSSDVAPETVPSNTVPGDGTTPATEEESAGEPSGPEALSAALIPEVQWFSRLDDPGADEYLDIAAAADRQPDPSEELPLLETRGFQGGWTRAFRNDTQDVVIAQVYEFETSTEAAFYLEDGLITLSGYGVEFFDLEALDGVRGFKQDGFDEIGPIVSFGLTFTVDRRWYLLTLTGDPATATLDILVGAVEAQLELAG